MKGGSIFGAAAHDFSLSEDVGQNPRDVVGSPGDFLPFHPVARLSGDLPNHDGDAEECKGVENGLGKGAIHE